MDNAEKSVKEVNSGNACDETNKVGHLETKKKLDKVIPVRLPSDKWELMSEQAHKLGIGPTTLARMWILERLRQHTKT
jgi:hypothetical protein